MRPASDSPLVPEAGRLSYVVEPLVGGCPKWFSRKVADASRF